MAVSLPFPDSDFQVAAPRLFLPTGAVLYRPGDPPRVDLVMSGLVRAYYAHPDGRETTFAFIHPGELLGPTWLWAPPPNFAQAVAPSAILALDPRQVQERMRMDGEFATMVAAQVTRRLAGVVRLVTLRTLGTMRERLVWDLLERFAGGSGEIEATHSQLAASLGTSREVITREMGALRDRGLVRTRPGRIKILDLARLQALLRHFEIGD